MHVSVKNWYLNAPSYLQAKRLFKGLFNIKGTPTVFVWVSLKGQEISSVGYLLT